MSGTTLLRRDFAAGFTGVAMVTLLLAGCAPEPQVTVPSPIPTETALSSYDGPLVFVGDELASFAPRQEDIVALVPGSSGVSTPSSRLVQISDGGGLGADPSVCEIFYFEQSLGSVGARSVEWASPGGDEWGGARLQVLQFADEQHAALRMDQLITAAEQCGRFDKEGSAAYDAVIAEEAEDVRAFAGTLTHTNPDYLAASVTGFAATGNLLVSFWQPLAGGDEPAIDVTALARVLQDRVVEAKGALIEEWTANPPSEEDPAAGSSGDWGDWSIGVGGVGPIALDGTVADAVGAAGDVRVVDPEYDGGPTTLVNTADTATIRVQPADGSDDLWKIIVGNERTFDTAPQVGEDLPARGDVRIGDGVSAAIEQFPGGTSVVVASSGDYFYAVTDRDGRVFRFHTDADASDGAATIIGITLEDGTRLTSASFE